MSKTYRNSGDGTVRSDGGKNYATPRYRPGSRRKPLRIVAKSVPRQNPDVERFGRAVIQAAMQQAAQETAAQTGRYSDVSGQRPSNPAGERGHHA